MNNTIDNWIKQVKMYPPSEIFSGKYGKEAKPEERIKNICEDLYFFSSETKINYLSNLFVVYRDLQVLYIFGFDRINQLVLNKTIEDFSEAAKCAIKELDAMFKKDQILNEYYKHWKLKYSDIKNELYYLKNNS